MPQKNLQCKRRHSLCTFDPFMMNRGPIGFGILFTFILSIPLSASEAQKQYIEANFELEKLGIEEREKLSKFDSEKEKKNEKVQSDLQAKYVKSAAITGSLTAISPKMREYHVEFAKHEALIDREYEKQVFDLKKEIQLKRFEIQKKLTKIQVEQEFQNRKSSKALELNREYALAQSQLDHERDLENLQVSYNCRLKEIEAEEKSAGRMGEVMESSFQAMAQHIAQGANRAPGQTPIDGNQLAALSAMADNADSAGDIARIDCRKEEDAVQHKFDRKHAELRKNFQLKAAEAKLED
jgi:hypothetical protein